MVSKNYIRLIYNKYYVFERLALNDFESLSKNIDMLTNIKKINTIYFKYIED